MPQMNGIEATRIIRREVPESAVILISQNDPIIVARQAAESGASGYLAKADLALNLVTVMNRVVERQKFREANHVRGDDGVFIRP